MDDEVTKPYSIAFKQKMVQRLIGENAVSGLQLSRETGVQQQTLSRWLNDARRLPVMVDKGKYRGREWTVEQKARILSKGSKLAEQELIAYLEREGVKLAEYERQLDVFQRTQTRDQVKRLKNEADVRLPLLGKLRIR